jgi:hypothetical protein
MPATASLAVSCGLTVAVQKINEKDKVVLKPGQIKGRSFMKLAVVLWKNHNGACVAGPISKMLKCANPGMEVTSKGIFCNFRATLLQITLQGLVIRKDEDLLHAALNPIAQPTKRYL